MVVLPSTDAAHYHKYCIDGGTSPENLPSVTVGFCIAVCGTERYRWILFCCLRYRALPLDFVLLSAVPSDTVGFCIAVCVTERYRWIEVLLGLSNGANRLYRNADNHESTPHNIQEEQRSQLNCFALVTSHGLS
jgi:hypothetical protein